MKRLLLALLLLTSSAEAGLITPPGVKGNSLPSSGQCNFATSIASDGTLTCTSPLNLYNSSAVIEIANEGTTGTGLNQLAKLTGAPSTAIKTGTGDTSGIEGIVVAGNGTTGNAQIARAGQALCAFDGATTAGDYVQNSPTTAGDCHDTGSGTFPTSGQVVGRVLTTHVGAGSYLIVIFSGVNGIPNAGMTTSGSNAASTAVAADWVPDGPGTRLLGSAANGWSGIYLVGDATGNGVKIVAASGHGSSNIYTLPSFGNSTFALANQSNTWGADQPFGGFNLTFNGGAVHWEGTAASGHAFDWWSSTNQRVYAFNSTAMYGLIVKAGNEGFNYAHGNQSNPTLFIHSANQNTTQWLGLTHNGTNGIISTGTGALDLSGQTDYIANNASNCTFCSATATTTGFSADDAGNAFAFWQLGTKYLDLGSNEGILFKSDRRVCWSTAAIGSGTNICWEQDAAGRFYAEDRVNSRPASVNVLHVGSNSSAPTVTAGCCTSPVVTGDDMSLELNVGTTCAGVTTCTVQFSVTRVNQPICVAQNRTSSARNPTSWTYPTNQKITVNWTSVTDSDVITLHCGRY